MSRQHRSFLLASRLPACLVAVGVAAALGAQDVSAQSSSLSLWSDPATWPNGKVPAAGDKVVSMSVIRHFEAEPAERAAYLKQRRLMAGNVEAVGHRGMRLFSELWHQRTARPAELVLAALEGNSAHQTWENLGRALETAMPLVEEGGYIAFCDHRVPPDVTLDHYLFYLDTVREVWGKGR